jgi:hypothetical protein
MRAVLWPLIGTLAFASLMQARRTDRMTLWAEAGIWVGLLWYTYFSALLWILYAGLRSSDGCSGRRTGAGD